MPEDITPDEVVDHIANSIEHYTDDYGYGWSVSSHHGKVVVRIDHPDDETKSDFYYLVPVKEG